MRVFKAYYNAWVSLAQIHPVDRERSRLAQNLEFINWIPQALTDCLEPDIEPILPDLLCNISAEIAKTSQFFFLTVDR